MTTSGYSSNVVLTLIICGVEIALSHVGSSLFIVRESKHSFAKGNAELVVSVDGVEDRKTVFLPHGISSGTSMHVYYM